MILWKPILKYGGSILALVGVVSFIYVKGVSHGKADIQKKWDVAAKAQEGAIKALQAKIVVKEQEHSKESARIDQELTDVKQDSADALAKLNADYVVRLRNAEDRYSSYGRAAEGGTAQCVSLASHATELDRSLEEGRRLVGELRQGIVEKDRQLILLGSQIKADRNLLSGPDANSKP